MKKIFCILACLFTLFLTAQADQQVIVQSGTTMKAYNKISDALNNVLTGDTIYLGTGQYDGFTLKALCYVRGNGPGTYINGDVTIDITGAPTPTEAVLQGLNINGNLNINKTINDLYIKHCQFLQTNFQAELPNCVIDRCYITNGFIINSFVNQMTVKHSKIKWLQGGSATNNGCTFINCNIYNDQIGEYSFNISGTFVNCLIHLYTNYPAGHSKIYDSQFDYCLIYNNGDYWYKKDALTNISDNCTITTNNNSNYKLLDDNCEIISKNYDIAKYVGNNGSVIGIYDNYCPFTLTPRVPKATKESITIDTGNKLKVSISVDPE